VRILVSCGEPSGWLFAGLLERALRSLESGLELIRPVHESLSESVVGFWEGLWVVPALRRRLSQTMVQVRRTNPDAVVLVGFSGFNLPFGFRCRRLGIPVVYYAPPQVWAWGRFRIGALKNAADKVVCLFPFEEGLLKQSGIDAVYLGYPLLDAVKATWSRHRVLGSIGLCENDRYMVFLPGSRPAETRFHQPLFRRVFQRLKAVMPDVCGVTLPCEAGIEARYNIIRHAECAVVVSGTATLETALLGTPQVVSYHLSFVSRWLARIVVRQRYFSLPNILLDRPAVPEFLDPTAEQLYSEVLARLRGSSRRKQARQYSAKLKELLGPVGATERIARLVLQYAVGSGAGNKLV